MAKSRIKAEYGDFQTPLWLAEQVCARLHKLGVEAATIIEPTCGEGNFLVAAARKFPQADRLVGIDINAKHLQVASAALRSKAPGEQATTIDLRNKDFFTLNGPTLFASLSAPLLVLGNPPWVTNTTLATLNSANQPPKSNFQQRSGIEAITGASNFDVSEWMILQLLEWTNPATTTLALLCKTAVARKVLHRCWQKGRMLGECHISLINAPQAFGAAVDACLLYIGPNSWGDSCQICSVYTTLESPTPTGQIAYRNNTLVADVQKYERWQHLTVDATHSQVQPSWRSGIKHDCASVMELVKCEQGYQNKFGDIVQLESELLFPLYKATDLTGNQGRRSNRWLIVTQSQVGSDTRMLRQQTPFIWQYLNKYSELLDNRQSTIYRGQPRFAIFGVGDYSFTPWKIAISGLHKSLQFVTIGPIENKPAVLDDTCYLLPCATQCEAELIAELLNSSIAREFFEAFIFWNDKRPVTAKLLRRLNIVRLAYELGREHEYSALCSMYVNSLSKLRVEQLQLLEKRADTLCSD